MSTSPPAAVRWAIVAAVPVVAFVVGAVALPRPLPVSAEKDAVDRTTLGSNVSDKAPAPRSKVDAELGDLIRVLGADLPVAAVSRGAQIEARFYFECLEELDEDWQIFLHIDAKAGSSRIHGDHYPVRGKYPTTVWKRGEFIADDWTGVVPRDASAGTYDVWLGFYVGEDRLEWSGGDRTAHDGSNRVRVGTIVVH